MAHGAGENAPLDVAPLSNEIVRRVTMRDPFNILFNDRPLVEIGRYVMRRRTDQLDASLMRLVVRFGALEPRQEGVMNVDAAPRQLCRKPVRQESGPPAPSWSVS